MTDSKYTIQGLTKNLQNNENNGWTGSKNKEWFKEVIKATQRKEGDVALK
jgi:ribonuclease HI